MRAGLRLRHWRRRNTRRQARLNSVAHCDLGNAFYGAWLDPSTYSSALFDGGAGRPLEAAQHTKYRRLLDGLALSPSSRILEIGCGWGGGSSPGGRARAAPRPGHRFGRDYAGTRRRWLATFDVRIADVRQQGFDERFVRGWRFYLAYCAAGFDSATTDVGHYVFVRDA